MSDAVWEQSYQANSRIRNVHIDLHGNPGTPIMFPASQSVQYSIVTDLRTGPSVPTNVAATEVSDSRIDLSWTAAMDSKNGIDHYNIYRDGSKIGESITTNFTDTGLTAATSYSYEVSAVNGLDMESERGTAVAAVTLGDSPPSTPTNVSATPISASQIDLSWTAATDPESGILRYDVYRNGTKVGQSATTSFSDTGLANATSYSYQVTATNAVDVEGARSTMVSASTLDGTASSTPTNVSATPISASRIDLSWTAALDPESGIDHYNIFRNGTKVGESTTTTFSDTGLANATSYSYRIDAVNGAGIEGSQSTAISAATLDGTAPSTPTNVGATPVSASRIDLSWTVAMDVESGILGYSIYRDGSFAGVSSTSSYSDTGLANATSYSYRIAAVNGAGIEGSQSTAVNAATLDGTPPSTPTNLIAAAVNAFGIDLSWTTATDAQSGIDHHNIYRDGTKVGESLGTDFSDAGLADDTSYIYQVAAVNGAGIEGQRSAVATATTPLNSVPALSPVADQAMRKNDDTVSVTLAASDADGDPLTYTAEVVTSDPLAELAYQLDQQLGLAYPGGNYYVNTRGAGEKYLLGNGNTWYYILPNGELHQSQSTLATSPLVDTLSATYHADPTLLHDAQPPVAGSDPGNVTLSFASNVLTIDPAADYIGDFQVRATVSDGADSDSETFQVSVTNRKPVLASIGDQTMSLSQDTMSITLEATDEDSDPLSYSVELITSDPLAELAYQLDQQLGLSDPGGDYYVNARGAGEKYLLGNGNTWYFILPNGELHQSQSTLATSPLVDTLSAAYHADPSLLHNAQPSAAGIDADDVTLSLVGNVLTIDPVDGFTGDFQVQATVTDGTDTVGETFQVSVTNSAPVLTPIGDRTMSLSQDT
ncbi:MAG: fibronectin type III domain-containing protein, partial [Candidatus Nealsonbacteria bacterium]|nr:fibronectin type III domain-containing protein [Candidatus Nealsonbacteria bacterium]